MEMQNSSRWMCSQAGKPLCLQCSLHSILHQIQPLDLDSFFYMITDSTGYVLQTCADLTVKKKYFCLCRRRYIYDIISFFFLSFFFNSRKKWVKHKLKTFCQIYICFVKSVQKTNRSPNVKQKSMYKCKISNRQSLQYYPRLESA